MSSYNTAADTVPPTKYKIFYSIVWMAIIIPIKGILNPLSFLDSSFIDKFDNNKIIILKTKQNKYSSVIIFLSLSRYFYVLSFYS
jgi:hypothetical protein